MLQRATFTYDISSMFSTFKKLFILLLTLRFVATTSNNQTINHKTINHSCYTCVEPLIGYTDHDGSCRFFNTTAPMAASYISKCNNTDDYTGEYECRKLVISFRSIETYLLRDCAPKGLCSWKDKTQSMIDTPPSNCVDTDVNEEKVECIYCCDTPLCNRTRLYNMTLHLIYFVLLINW
ncbi:unnamed protein product [Rotaria magnacalcarata]|nr:unnamed protein product [Rotaria magnacalcarata]CAF1373333.1 unnamed protein product [Rotaria magnacalcarata]CAF2133964.1 unnamed protein product [Rotaria magnacalcarata]